jgi:hypothetical protein
MNLSCWAYPPGAVVPDEFWRKIELRYPDDRIMTFIYRTEPPAGELPELMLKLQAGAARAGFRIFVTDEDGETVEAPPLPNRKATP